MTHISRRSTYGAAARDGAPRNRNRVVELAVGVCVIAVLTGLYILNNAAMTGKARMTYALWGKSVDEKPLLENLAIEGRWGNASNGEFVSLVKMRNGTVAGLKFFTGEDSLYVVNWKCKQASEREVADALKLLPAKTAVAFKGLEPVELPAEYGFKVCQRGDESAR